MKIIELIIGSFFLLTIILKIINIEGSSWLLFLTSFILSLFYLFFGFFIFNEIKLRGLFKTSSYDKTNTTKIIMSILLGMSLTILLTGIYFKLQLWSGGDSILGLGLICTGLILLISIILYFRNKDILFKRWFSRMVIIGGIGLILILTSRSQLIDIYYRGDIEFAELYKQYINNPNDPKIKENFHKEWKQRHQK